MNGKLERIIQLRQSNQKDHCPVPGIHLKVEQDLQIIQDGVFDIVRFINDDHRSFPFIQRKTVDLLLDDMKVFCFAVGSLRTKRHGKIPVEVIHCNCGEAGIDHLIQRRIQPGRPGTYQGCLSPARSAGKKAEAFGSSKVIQPERRLRKFSTIKKDLFRIL